MPNINLPLSKIPMDQPLRVESEGLSVVVIRSGNGVKVYEDVCPHAAWPLSEGEVSGSVLECPGHGWEFDVETGKCLNAPAYCLRSIPASVVGESVLLELDAVLNQTKGCV